MKTLHALYKTKVKVYTEKKKDMEKTLKVQNSDLLLQTNTKGLELPQHKKPTLSGLTFALL
jgi:hypothetical protein